MLGDVSLEGLKNDCDENQKITAHFKESPLSSLPLYLQSIFPSLVPPSSNFTHYILVCGRLVEIFAIYEQNTGEGENLCIYSATGT